jgi:hypothetical protein
LGIQILRFPRATGYQRGEALRAAPPAVTNVKYGDHRQSINCIFNDFYRT